MEAIENNSMDEKVVFVFEKGSQFDENLSASNYFQNVKKILDNILRMNHVDSNRIFFGGDKEDLAFFISGFIQFCKLADNLEINQCFEFENDPDFDMTSEDSL